MVFKGNFKGRRRTKSGRKMSKKAAELGRKTSRDNKILKTRNYLLQKRIREAQIKRALDETRANKEASNRLRVAKATDKKFQSERARAREWQANMNEAGNAGTVTIKAHVRKLANGAVINVRSFLRRVAKKISK